LVSETLLLVLIVQEAGLRSALAASLSLAGADVLTADDFADPRLARHRRRPLVLITDEAAVEGFQGGSKELARDPRWLKLVLLSPGAAGPNGDPKLLRLDRASAARTISRLLPEWQRR
jgi:hypothetical protein